ncbi:MAG: hypothetical protein IJA67_06185 [Oscillospiraceae bacterium]|nr:hypothetical protein [Oscillospiraceae bacterium]
MKKFKKALALLLCAVLLVAGSVAGTLAYLQAKSDVVQNTFTVGDVKIKLDEAKVDLYGEEVAGAERVMKNDYKLLPGHTYVKDPTVTVEAKSEDCYVRVFVTVSDISKLKEVFPTFVNTSGMFMLENLVNGWDGSKWACVGYEKGKYEFRYHKVVEYSETPVKLEPLFTHVEIPGTVSNTDLAKLQNLEIDVVAEAIQADGFSSAADAWAQWNSTQNP